MESPRLDADSAASPFLVESELALAVVSSGVACAVAAVHMHTPVAIAGVASTVAAQLLIFMSVIKAVSAQI
jgi:hypothetical protein